VTPPRIVRYPHRRGGANGFWMDKRGGLMYLPSSAYVTIEEAASRDGGFAPTEECAAACGTTLAAIREALTREESGE